MDLSYILNQLGEEQSEYFNAIAPPIIQTSNFSFPSVGALRDALQDEMSSYLYSRGINPTTNILRKKLAALDEAEDCLVFNNGAAATFAAVMCHVKSGDHIVSVRNPYTWTAHLFDKILPRFGVTTTYVDGRQIENFERAILPNTSVIYVESPNSWYFELQDLMAVAELARSENITTICDNSYCTPLYQKPIVMGIDLVMQTATKYIGGHSDTLGGVLTGSAERIRKIFESEFLCIGSGIQPFNAWLLIRGLRTLPSRLDRISNTTKKVLQYLKNQGMVEEVIFPMDRGFPQWDLAQKQMKGACGLISIIVKHEMAHHIERFCETLHHFRMAVSWGGHESLIIPKMATLSHRDFNPSDRNHRMLRLYIGLEEADYLIEDLDRAFLHVNG